MREPTEEEYLVIFMSPFRECIKKIEFNARGKPIALYLVESSCGYEFNFGKFALYASFNKWDTEGQHDCFYLLFEEGKTVLVSRPEWEGLQTGILRNPIVKEFTNDYFLPKIIGWE